MSVYGGPEVVDSGLVLSLDAANSKSYPGYGTAWTDLSGNGLNATIGNSPAFTTANGGILTYLGTNTGTTATSTSSLFNVGTGDFTVECWVNLSTLSTYNPVFSLDDTLSGLGITLYLTASPSNFRTWIGNTANNTTTQLTTGAWTHLVVSRASGTVSKYINGVLDGTHVASGSCSTGQTAKIAWRYDAAYTFNGSVGKLNFYNVALTAAQVAQNYNATLGRYSNLPFSPYSISGLQLWLDASDSRTLFSDTSGTTLASSDGTAVALWKDKSGNTRDVSQSTSGSRPLLKKAVVNSLDGVRFDGSNDFLSFAMNTRPTSYTVFVVASKTNSTAATYCGSSNTAGDGYSRYFELSTSAVVTNDLFALVGNGNTSYRYVYSATNTIALSTPTLTAVTNSITNPAGIDLRIYKNASELSVTTVGNNFTGIQANNFNFAVGRLGDYNGSYLQGDICEIVIYDSALSTTQRQQVESYLNTKWKIY